MGMTHYWYREKKIEGIAWNFMRADIWRLVDAAHNKLNIGIAGWDGTKKAQFTELLISFNGEAPQDYETFDLPRNIMATSRNGRQHTHFQFCKTGGKPYDIVVMAALIIAHKHSTQAKQVFDVKSDADAQEWLPAAALCDAVLGEGFSKGFLLAGEPLPNMYVQQPKQEKQHDKKVSAW